MLGTLHWAVNKTALCPRVLGDADVHRARGTQNPGGEDEHARRNTSYESFFLRRDYHRVAPRATLVDPRADRVTGFDVWMQIDQV